MAIAALKWLAFSERPLTVQELAEASVINPDSEIPFEEDERLRDPHDILQVLSSLVTASNERVSESSDYRKGQAFEMIRLAHFSVKEYLISDRIRFGPASIFVTVDKVANQFLAESCLHYISHYSLSRSKAWSRKDLDIFPLLYYACYFWKDHIKAIQDTSSIKSTDLVCSLLDSVTWRSAWLHVHNPLTPCINPFQHRIDLASSLYYASTMGLYSISKALIDSGADVNELTGVHRNALSAAVLQNQKRIVQLLLEHGANIEARNSMGQNPLYVAAARGHEVFVRLLLDNGADINARGGFCGTALQAVAVTASPRSENYEAILRLLIERGADININKEHRESPFNWGSALNSTSTRGNEAMVQLLLDGGADINARDRSGTALQSACFYGNKNIVRLLLTKGADVDVKGGVNELTGLQAAARRGYTEIVQLLLENGADINLQTEISRRYSTALQEAYEYSKFDTVKFLLKNGASFDAKKNAKMVKAAKAKNYNKLTKLLVTRDEVTGSEEAEYGDSDPDTHSMVSHHHPFG